MNDRMFYRFISRYYSQFISFQTDNGKTIDWQGVYLFSTTPFHPLFHSMVNACPQTTGLVVTEH